MFIETFSENVFLGGGIQESSGKGDPGTTRDRQIAKIKGRS
ncbi:hypothetical protein CES86_3964 [Brucella lupini]|uniref:Uncharacterized protein n=1 Tax=Brucella lupini TaxID=255457 RepID=A0A256GG45_9HYPH|nr:hypothetical protein CES86_3964 [Brucella lupini]